MYRRNFTASDPPRFDIGGTERHDSPKVYRNTPKKAAPRHARARNKCAGESSNGARSAFRLTFPTLCGRLCGPSRLLTESFLGRQVLPMW
ncbi:hypothetical protein AWB66_02709 [Caballeronia telluris]|uniref:Uncharacterized protein n=1 Tax=Caballeronia telluris TaxID=326475 RepID=A0A158HY15_9BURK|nr:hypothetical protein AWB66_02709 [Caballeronia telluris]